MVVPAGILVLLKRKRAQEEVVPVPKFIPRLYRHVVEEPIPKTQEKIVHDPKIIQQEPITQQHGEMDVVSPDPKIQEEFVHEPKIIQQEPITTPREDKLHRRLLELEARVEGLVGTSSFVDSLFEEEVPIPMTQEEIIQEEIIQEPKFIQQTELGRVLPFSPKTRDLHMQVFFQVLPSVRYAWITP